MTTITIRELGALTDNMLTNDIYEEAVKFIASNIDAKMVETIALAEESSIEWALEDCIDFENNTYQVSLMVDNGQWYLSVYNGEVLDGSVYISYELEIYSNGRIFLCHREG